jgi:GT2 family glycosyltransferase
MSYSIDIVIPTYNRPKIVRATINALFCQLLKQDRIIVVWQGEKPEVQNTDRVMLLQSSPPNLPRARNCGVRAGKNRIILMLDDDIDVYPELLDRHRISHYDETVACVAGYIEDAVYDKQKTEPSSFDFRTGRLIQNFSCHTAGLSVSAPGGNMSVKREAFEAVKGFDENFKGNALWEEIDFSFRLRAKGMKIIFNPDAGIKHLRNSCGGCRRKGDMSYLYRQFANTGYFAVRWAPAQYYRSWLNYWKYRLEFISRSGKITGLKHNPLMVLVALLGALAGLSCHAVRGRKLAPTREEYRELFNQKISGQTI